jgi:putative ABC transport system permease protein
LTNALLGAFAATALLLAAIGIYGLMSANVSERIREFGIRIALGAQTRDVLTLVLRRGIVLVLVGLAAGVGGALAVTRFLSSLLFDVSSTDPTVFGAVSLLLAGVALLACYFPARRATKVDPMVALRYE